MYGRNQKRVAIETSVRFEHGSADTITERGHPSATILKRWRSATSIDTASSESRNRLG